MKQCTVEGCGAKARSNSSPYCEKHYMRMYRHGVLERTNVAKERIHSAGYVTIPANGHPLARGHTYVYAHRAIYYNAHGEGPFNCHWCSKEVTWDSLHIDHLDDNKQNNAVENLAASCAFCNQQRGLWKAPAAWRKRHGISAFGLTLTASEWERLTGTGRTAIKDRINKGWTPERAITAPVYGTGPKKEVSEKQLAAVAKLLDGGQIDPNDYRSPAQIAAANAAALVM